MALPTINFGTSRYVAPAAPPNPNTNALTQSMLKQKAEVGGLNPNLVTPSTLGTQVPQPMRQLDYSNTSGVAPPNNLPPSDTTTQTGQGGGQSAVPGASQGQPGQATGLGGNPVGSAGGAPGAPIPKPPAGTIQDPRRPPTGAVAPPDPSTTSWWDQLHQASANPQGIKPLVDATGHPIPQTQIRMDAAGHPINIGSVQSYKSSGPDTWYGSLSGAPQAPTGGDTTQHFNTANSIASQSQSPTGQKFLANIGKYGQSAANNYLSMPQSFTVADFNNVAQSNPTLAVQMLGQGGQAMQDAIRKNNNWTQQQMNQFINAYGSGAMPGVNQQNLTAAGYTGGFGPGYTPPATTPTTPTPTPAPPGAPAPVSPPTTTASPGAQQGFGYFDPYWTQLYGQR